MKRWQEKIISWVTSNVILTLFLIFIFYTAGLVIYRKYHLIAWLYDDADKTNLISIILFVGVILVLYESIKMREIEHQPVLSLYVRDSDKTPEEFRIFEYRVLAIRNTGKGVAQNLRVQINDKNGQLIPIRWLEQTIISPAKDEIRIMLENKLEKCGDLDGSKITISAESVNKKVYTYTYTLEKLSDRIVRFEDLKNEK